MFLFVMQNSDICNHSKVSPLSFIPLSLSLSHTYTRLHTHSFSFSHTNTLSLFHTHHLPSPRGICCSSFVNCQVNQHILGFGNYDISTAFDTSSQKSINPYFLFILNFSHCLFSLIVAICHHSCKLSLPLVDIFFIIFMWIILPLTN